MKRTRAIMPMTRIPTSVAGSTMLELEVSLTDTSGREADSGLLTPDPLPGAMLGNEGVPELGTSGVTSVGGVGLGVTASCVPEVAAWAVSPVDLEGEV
jgi:hypothetical protein